MSAYKQSAFIQVVKNQVQLLETSNLKVMYETSQQMKNLFEVVDTTKDKFQDAAVSLGGFTRYVVGGAGSVSNVV